MQYALIDKTGAVVNIIVVEKPEDYVPDEGFYLVASEVAEIGGSFDNGVYAAPAKVIPDAAKNQSIIAQIEIIERNSMRTLREAVLGIAEGRPDGKTVRQALGETNDKIVALRQTLNKGN